MKNILQTAPASSALAPGIASEIKTSDVIFRKDLYPRLQGDASKVKEYGAHLRLLPPIEINQHNELIDGWHRWTAHKEKGQQDIAVTITETDDDAAVLKLAIQRNNKHGMQLSLSDKRRVAIQIYKATAIENRAAAKDDLAQLFSVEARSIYNWTQDIDAADKSERDALIMRLFLHCHTQEEIANVVGVPRRTVSDVLAEIEKFQISPKPSDFDHIEKVDEKESAILAHNTELATFADFDPPIYNIWSFGKKSNSVEHFGNTEQRIVENLLWLYTKPFDVVFDPFAGGGSSIDVCESRLRRCFASDRKPVESRGDAVRAHDICDGMPKLPWSDVSLAYLDPPYWRQAENQYSNDAEDLANMPLDMFTKKLSEVVLSLSKKLRPTAVIALIIQPTQWKSEPKGKFTDHVFDLIAACACKRLEVENRISCPYSTEQYNAQMVDWSKENQKPLVLTRELIVWRVL